MEEREVVRKSKKRMERMIMTVYGVYALLMSALVGIFQWGSWIIPIIIFGFIISIVMCVKEYRDFSFRAYVISSLILLDYFIYGIFNDSYLALISTACVLVVLLSLFQIERIMIMTMATTVLLNLFHIFIEKSFVVEEPEDLIMIIIQCLSIFAVEALAYYLIRSQNMLSESIFQELDSLKQMEQSKDDFMANLSHEVRTPVNTVVGMTEMILHENVSDSIREYAMNVQTASRNLLTTVSDVLDFSELQSGKIVLTEEPYNLTSTINDILNIAMAQREGRKIELIVDCDPQIPCSLLGDEQKLGRVILNIMSNAIKFTEEGAVILQVSMRKEQKESVNLIFKIRDTGKGIEEKNIEKLFTSFNQVDTKRNRQEGGIGLGLAISKAIIEKMNGFVNVRSKLGMGTEVQFVVPQQILDSRPMIKLEKPDEIRLIYYIRMAKYDHGAVRDEYQACIRHMQEQLGKEATMCRNLAELKRRISQEIYTHLFISWEEYIEDKEYFDSIQEELHIILIMDERPTERVGAHIRQIYKPFYVLSVAAMLNREDIGMTFDTVNLGTRQFVAPDASVLVVDDNVMNLKVMEGLLRPYKIKVFVAESGQEALNKLSSMAFDFVFMDHMMPEMDGVECFHRIRKRPGLYFQEVPIIALTANAIAGAREMFLSEGFQDFVAKPVELSALERVLRKYIPEEKIQNLKDEELYRKKTVLKKDEEETEDKGENGTEKAAETVKESGTKVVEETAAAKTEAESESAVNEEQQTEGADVEENSVNQRKMEKILADVGVNVEDALALYGGEMEFYKEMLLLFAESGPSKREEVENVYQKADWKQYTILVHAVKSNAGTIGARKLASMAKALERAGKEDKITFIREQHSAMMEQYQATIEAVERAMR